MALCFLLSHLLSQVHRGGGGGESRKGDFVSTKKYWTLPKSCGSQSSEWEELRKSRAKRGSLCARRRSRKTVTCHGLRVVEPMYHQALLRGRSRSWRRNGRKAGLGEARFVNLANLARQLHRSCLICCLFLPFVDRQSLRLPVDGCGGAGREFRKTSNAADVQSCVSSSKNHAPNPIEQRKWAFIPNVDKVDNARYLVSKQMTNLLRHQPELR